MVPANDITPVQPPSNHHFAVDLAEVVDTLVRAIRPERVILFGSRARGDHSAESDIDLFVEIESGRDPAEAEKDCYRALRRSRLGAGTGIDVVVKDQAYVERYRDLVGTIVRPVLKVGKVLYARS